MSEEPKETSSTYRKLTMEDLINFGCVSDNNNNNKNFNSNDIPKNQKVFGHNKRIKP
jgi:hypothetical protein